MIALTISVQLRDKVRSVLELLIEGKFMLKESGIRSLRARVFHAKEMLQKLKKLETLLLLFSRSIFHSIGSCTIIDLMRNEICVLKPKKFRNEPNLKNKHTIVADRTRPTARFCVANIWRIHDFIITFVRLFRIFSTPINVECRSMSSFERSDSASARVTSEINFIVFSERVILRIKRFRDVLILLYVFSWISTKWKRMM